MWHHPVLKKMKALQADPAEPFYAKTLHIFDEEDGEFGVTRYALVTDTYSSAIRPLPKQDLAVGTYDGEGNRTAPEPSVTRAHLEPFLASNPVEVEWVTTCKQVKALKGILKAVAGASGHRFLVPLEVKLESVGQHLLITLYGDDRERLGGEGSPLIGQMMLKDVLTVGGGQVTAFFNPEILVCLLDQVATPSSKEAVLRFGKGCLTIENREGVFAVTGSMSMGGTHDE